MNELVVVGYGVVKKSDATGSVGVVKPSEIEAGLASTAQGFSSWVQAPVVVVSTEGGNPAGGAAIQIRGGASFGLQRAPYRYRRRAMDGNTVKGSSNPCMLAKPREYRENMTILKSASATAIYGSRASNGVIIITSKRGKEAQTAG